MQTFLEISIITLAVLFCIAIVIFVTTSIKALFEWLRRKKKQEAVRLPISGNPDKISHWHLYLLKLQDGKYYVGITSRTPEIRMNEHLNGIRVAYWTAKYKPLEIIYTEDLGSITRRQAEKRENNMVRACMRERGLNNVRGGDLTSTDEYIVRFGYIFDKDGWAELMMVVCLLLILAYFVADKYFL